LKESAAILGGHCQGFKKRKKKKETAATDCQRFKKKKRKKQQPYLVATAKGSKKIETAAKQEGPKCK
jgi:hypothetical protein